jgi:hypothetical protein
MDRPRIRSRTFAGALACALTGPLLVLSACGGGDDSVADPPISSSPSSSSPTSAPHRETPEHFIRRWTQAEEKMENTGQTDEYLALSRHCRPCSALAKEVKGFYKAGGYVRWGGWTIKSMTKSTGDGELVTFTVRIDSAPTEYKEASDGPTRHLAGGLSTELLTLQKSSTGWLMHNTVEQASRALVSCGESPSSP